MHVPAEEAPVDAIALVDAATPEPALVAGSLPPAGRDLDLLVRPAAEAALAHVLSDNGFERSGRSWTRFAKGSAEVVELIPSDSLKLDGEQLERLFEDAEAVQGLRSLARPAAHHRLLLLARRVSREARLDAKRRASAEEADAEAWGLARELAGAWGAKRALRQLEQALAGHSPASWRVRSPLARAERYKPGALITFSGLDGSGKSTQVEALERALSKAGYPTISIWTSLGGNPSLRRIVAPMRALLKKQSTRTPGVEWPPAGQDDDPLTQLRERLPGLQLAWITLVAAMNAWRQARAVRPQLAHGRVVICDRYTLDSIVNLRYRYGDQRSYRAQLALIRLLSPKPLCSYLLEVSPGTARARNHEYTLEQIELRARLYRKEHERLGVARLDGERTAEDLSQQIAHEVWSTLEDKRKPNALARALRAVRRLLGRA
jgi:thymidylate kinase